MRVIIYIDFEAYGKLSGTAAIGPPYQFCMMLRARQGSWHFAALSDSVAPRGSTRGFLVGPFPAVWQLV